MAASKRLTAKTVALPARIAAALERQTASAESTETALVQALGAGASAPARPDATVTAPALSSDPVPASAAGTADPLLGAGLGGTLPPLAGLAAPLLDPVGDPLDKRDLAPGIMPEADRREFLREVEGINDRVDAGPGIARAERIPARLGPRPALDVGELAREPLPTISLLFDENYEFEVELEPRFSYQKVSASYFDTDKGTLEREEKSGASGKGGDALPHPMASKEAAKAAAPAVAQAWQAQSGTGVFSSHGLPEAVAGAPVTCVGYGTPIDDTKWISKVVTHDVVPFVGWNTTIETEADTD